MRVNKGQEFVIDGYTIGNPFDALVFGYYEGKKLMYVARTRNGFTPASRRSLFVKFRGLGAAECPFVNLPETHSGWGAVAAPFRTIRVMVCDHRIDDRTPQTVLKKCLCR